MSNWAQEFAPEFPISKTVYQIQAIVEFQNTTSICNKLSCLIISSLHVWFLHISVLMHFHDFSLWMNVLCLLVFFIITISCISNS